MRCLTPAALCHRCALGACLAISACTTAPPSAIELPAPVATKAWARLAQHGYGAQAAFALCRGDACPQPTTKTLNTAPRVIAPVVPDPVADAPVPLIESKGPGEQVEVQIHQATPATEGPPSAQPPPEASQRSSSLPDQDR
ncbi:hypothetical protein Ajs_1543 [Acidovorax sp. JS42]|nr:hypothetical protein Ajs_1543 [Acidovorax sp. JS42]